MGKSTEWRACTLAPDIYEIAEDGQLRLKFKRHKWPQGHILSPNIDRYGYHRYHLYIDGQRKAKMAHVLVALAFLGEPELPTMEVNHIDGVKNNNHYSNLEWVTHAENIQHSWKYLNRRASMAKGERIAQSKLTRQNIIEIRKLAKRGHTQRAIAKRFGVTHVNIGHVLRGTTWAHVPTTPTPIQLPLPIKEAA